MKILIFEYVTGGGLCREDLPDSLAAEGLLMVKALLRDLAELETVEPIFLLDARLAFHFEPLGDTVRRVLIDRSDNVFSVLKRQLADCDAVWPVAPEMDNILYDLIRLIEKHRKPVLSPPSEVVALTADKLRTYQHLTAHGIDAVTTEIWPGAGWKNQGKQVFKPIDGMGCEQTFVIDGADDLVRLLPHLDASERYIVQPFVEGRVKSLSALFRRGKGWLLSVNNQIIQINNQRVKLMACQVNVPGETVSYQALVDRIADVLPDLWGYAGIDFIETPEGISILEINPRLTTSYAGIHQALGINVAEKTLSMLEHEPVISPSKSRTICISVEREMHNAN
ncbi:MAG: ATP-grasp domain-containing protein [Gammaproteobacteria bacterium]